MPKAAIRYVDPDMEGGQYQYTITQSALKKMGKERQKDIMRHWFREHYEDPVNSQPHDSEIGYIYINGGPFDAREELENQFAGVVPEKTINDLVNELEKECVDWTRTAAYDQELYPREDDFYEIEAALADQKPIQSLKDNLIKLLKLLDEKDHLDQTLHKFQLMMIFSFCITSLEAYLSDVFTKRIMGDKKLKAKYLQCEGAFRDNKIPLKSIFEQYEQIDNVIKKGLSDTSFHNLGRIKVLFKGVLDVDVGDIDKLMKLINKRHDFVHRNGKDTDGNEVTTTKDEVKSLISSIEHFCANIDVQLNPPPPF